MSADPPIARLVLEDGTVFVGRAFGACAEPQCSTGEVVFNTAMTGYQEALSDPSYAGQILVMTAPMMGNYGVCREDCESRRPQVAGFVVRELARRRSNHRAVEDLSSWLAEAGVLGVQGLDTRALVRRIRTEGAMRGVVTCDASKSDRRLVQMALSSPKMAGRNLAVGVSPPTISTWTEGLGVWRPGPTRRSPDATPLRVVALDCGAKRNIYRNLIDRGCTLTVAPHNLSADQIRELSPDGLVVSNGPGDPEAVSQTVDALRAVAGEVPTLGICLGHQLLALALGAKTFKLKFGHRGANQPVRNILSGRVEITSQNHGFCVDADSLGEIDCEVTHIHLNDGTLAGFRHRSRPIFSVQFHPEASPGPHDSAYLFDWFVDMMRTGRPVDGETMLESPALGHGAEAAGGEEASSAATPG